MSIQKDIIEQVVSITEDMKLMQEKKEQEIIEKEIYDIQLELALDKNIWWIFLVVVAMCLALCLKLFAKPVLKCILYHEPFKISGSLVVWAGIFAAIVAGGVLLLIYMTTKKLTVQGSSLIYRGRQYHYSQISKIKISSIFVATVFVEGKKLFCISRDFVNYDAFICWAGKCRIPIEESEPLTEKDVTKITIWFVLVFLFLFAVVYVCVVGRLL